MTYRPLLDRVYNLRKLRLRQTLGPYRRLNVRPCEHFQRVYGTNPINVPKRDVHTLLAWYVNTQNSWHGNSFLTLALLVAGIRADHPDHALAPYHLAVFAKLLHRRSHFHLPFSFYPHRSVKRC